MPSTSLARDALIATTILLAVTDLGLFSAADGAVVAFFIALKRPILSPLLLLPLATLQDTPGLAGHWWYAAFVAVGSVVLLTTPFHAPDMWRSRWGQLVSIVIGYAVVASILHSLLAGHPQAPTRPPITVGGLAIFMVWCGLAAGYMLRSHPDGPQAAAQVAWALLAHGLLLGVLQAGWDPQLLASPSGRELIKNTPQLIIPTVLGYPRITGTFLTPNGFALALLLVLLASVALTAQPRMRGWHVVVWFVTGLALVLLSLSKAAAIFYSLTALTAVIMRLGWRRSASFALLVLLAASLPLAVAGPTIQAAFGVTCGIGEDSYRSLAWQLTVRSFDAADWLFGTGLSYWPEFFASGLSVNLADPHTWLLSLPGTFGAPGIIFFLLLVTGLGLVVRNSQGERRWVAIALGILMLLKDLVSEPLLLGNTPLTFLLWLTLSTVLEPSPRTPP
jgi:hypothetical protein